MAFTEVMEHVAQAFEALGAVTLLGGLVLALGLAARDWHRLHDRYAAYLILRRSFGGVILFGLEILVAADLIHTVAVQLDWQNVVTLGAIVAIRTFLSFSLEIEIEGCAPWRRAALTGSVGAAPGHRATPGRDAG